MIPGRLILDSTREVILPHINKTETLFERTRGLLGCKALAEGHGLLICPCNSIHTFFMTMPLDIIFLRKDNTIVALKTNMKPQRFAISLASSSVLELMAGQIDRSGLRKGDRLVWESSL